MYWRYLSFDFSFVESCAAVSEAHAQKNVAQRFL